MASNLELKVRCPDNETLAARAVLARRAGTTYVRTLEQRDTYFNTAKGRLKVRQWSVVDEAGSGGTRHASGDPEPDARRCLVHGAELIAYARPDEPGTRRSDYIITPVAGEEVIAALGLACDIRVVVDKVRLLYRYGATRIHFDTVAGLGAFIELETVLPEGSSAPTPEALAAHAAVVARLELGDLPSVAGSYSELMLAAKPLGG